MKTILPHPIKAAVCIPPIEDFYMTPHRNSSLGASIVVQLLKSLWIDTYLIDGIPPESSAIQIPLPKSLTYLSPYILPHETGKCTFFRHYHHFGLRNSDIGANVAQLSPYLCFIACFAFCYSTTTIELSKEIKNSIPDVTVIAGGAGVTVHPEYFLRNSSIDYTLSGEAEITLPSFIDFIKRGEIFPEKVPFLGWKEEGHCFFSSVNSYTTALTLQPIIKKLTVYKTITTFTMSFSRGCPYGCTFCANHLAHGHEFRYCSIEKFREQLDRLEPSDYTPKIHINFEDDNLLCAGSIFHSIMAICKTRFPSAGFFAENGIDYRLLSHSTCTHLIRIGFRQFNFTVGSCLPQILATTGRQSEFKQYDELLHLISHYALPVVSYIICGLPTDTKQTIATNLTFLKQRRTFVGLSLFYAVPGLPGFTDLLYSDSLSPEIFRGSSAYPWNSSLSVETLVTAFRLARFINLIKNPVKTVEEKELIDKTVQSRSLHTIIRERGHRTLIRVPFQDEELVKMVV